MDFSKVMCPNFIATVSIAPTICILPKSSEKLVSMYGCIDIGLDREYNEENGTRGCGVCVM